LGIRYYAYAFDADVTEQALAAPQLVISADPLADAWGLPHGFRSGVADEQAVPQADMLYLDKAWSLLQAVTRPHWIDEPARPAYRMFEGDVTFNPDGSHKAWLRAISPDELIDIASDVASINDDDVAAALRDPDELSGGASADIEYATEYLHSAQRFTSELARTGRGFVYTIR